MHHDIDINQDSKAGLAKAAGWLGAIAGFNVAVMANYPNFIAAMLVSALLGVGASYYKREAGFLFVLISAAIILKACSPKQGYNSGLPVSENIQHA